MVKVGRRKRTWLEPRVVSGAPHPYPNVGRRRMRMRGRPLMGLICGGGDGARCKSSQDTARRCVPARGSSGATHSPHEQIGPKLAVVAGEHRRAVLDLDARVPVLAGRERRLLVARAAPHRGLHPPPSTSTSSDRPYCARSTARRSRSGRARRRRSWYRSCPAAGRRTPGPRPAGAGSPIRRSQCGR